MDTKQTLKPYTYKSLLRPESIRVLNVYPATDFSAPLLCEIHHDDRKGILNDFSRERYYNTVSYTWGEAIFSHHIICDDGTSLLKVTAHVDSMLRYLRKSHRSVLLWIDAICLNQEDNNEKAIQVQLMDEIYRYARKTHIWLGDGDDADAVAVFQFIQCGLIQKDPPRDPEDIYRTRGYSDNPRLLSILSRAPFSSVEKLLRLPWFQRRWVIQEAVLSFDSTIHWGARRTSWNLLLAGLRMLKPFAKARLDTQTFEILGKTCALGLQDGNILSLIWQHHTAQCSDPRDRLFSLFSMAKDVTDRNLDLKSTANPKDDFYNHNRRRRDLGRDYASSYTIAYSAYSDFEDRPTDMLNCSRLISYEHDWIDVYRLFTKECLKAHLVQDIMHHCYAFGSLSSHDPSASSWVPDWSGLRHDGTLAAANSFHRDPHLHVESGQLAHELKVGSESPFPIVERTLRGRFWSQTQEDLYHLLVLHPLLEPKYNLIQALLDGLHHGLFDQQLLSIELLKRLGSGRFDMVESEYILRVYLTEELGRKQRDPNSLAFFSNLMETHSFYVCEDGSAGIGPTTLKRGDVICTESPFYVMSLGRGSILSPVLRCITPTLQDAPKYRISGYVIHREIHDADSDGRDGGYRRDRRYSYSNTTNSNPRDQTDDLNIGVDKDIDIFTSANRVRYEDSNHGDFGGSVSISLILSIWRSSCISTLSYRG